MKRQSRLPYLVIDKMSLPNGNYTMLCSWCKYSEWNGDCKESEVDCKHPLPNTSFSAECCVDNYTSDGDDCWLFKPNIAATDATDIVGLWLQGKNVDWESVPKLGRRPK